jgi:cobalt/nickel transport system ATP-binding protein
VALTILEAANLRFAYGRTAWAIDGLSLSMRTGDRLALLGANGAGKSTLLHLLVGLHSPSEGSLRLEGCPVPDSAAGRALLRGSVGLVLQDPDDQLFASTVEADVYFGPLNTGLRRSEAETAGRSAMDALRISNIADRRISTLSLGEKKRVALAGVLAMRPKVLLLDEPTAGLDHNGVHALLSALAERSAAGMPIMLATHNSDLALEWASRVVVLDHGRAIAESEPARAFQDESLCLRAGLRQPVIFEIGRRLREELDLAPGADLPASASQLASGLLKNPAIGQGAKV